MTLNIKKQLGKRIKELRLARGYSQEQFAEKLGIASRTLCGIEIGKNFLKADTLENILNILEVTPQELFLINHLQPQEVLVDEIINTVKEIKDRQKIETLYKIVKSFV
ncbi:helix-turn-helix transcriptional regulator [bacterium]|nr:helix-turn-helix transcriptional regulator [bacterium]